MANTEILDSFVDPGGVKQFQDIQKASADATAQFLDNIKAAKELLAITGGATTSKQFQKDQLALAAATEKVVQAQQKSAQEYQKAEALKSKRAKANNDEAKSLIQLQQVQDRQAAALVKTTQAAQKALSPYQQLSKELERQRLAAKDLAVQYGETSPQFLEAAKGVTALDSKLKTIDGTLGQSQRNVGNYGSAFSKLYGYIRTAANILPGVGISGIFLGAGEAIAFAAEKLELFNNLIFKISQVDVRKLAFKEAFEGESFKKGVENVQQLAVNLELAKTSIIDQNKVVDEYNETIGTVTGRVDNFTQAQAGFVANSDKYIAAILNEAAAQSILASSAKDFADVAEANNKIRETIIANNKILSAERKGQFAGNGPEFAAATEYAAAATLQEDVKRREATNVSLAAQIDKNTKSLSDRYKNRAAVLKETATEIAKVTGAGVGQTNTGTTGVDKLNNDISNNALEREKNKQQSIIDNEKLSFSVRLKAVQDYATAERSIAENNEKLSLSAQKLSDNEKLKVTQEYNNAVENANNEAAKKSQSLRDQQAKLTLEHQKNDLDAQKQVAKIVIDDPASSLDQRLEALTVYRQKSQAIINKTYEDEIKQAGDVKEKIKLINDRAFAANNALILDGTQQETKIFQDEYNKQLANATDHDKKLINSIKLASEQQQQDITDSTSAQLEFAAEQRAKGLITEKKYQFDVLNIQHQGNLALLQDQLDSAQKLLDLEKAANPDNPDIPIQQKKISDLKRAIQKESTDFNLKQFKTEEDARRDLAKNEIELATQTANAIKSIVDSSYQSRIDAIEKQKQALSDAADVEKKGIENSLDTQNNKAAREAVLDAQTKARQDQLTKEQQDIKRKQAVFDKAFSIAQATEASAVAEVQALTYLSNPITAPFYPAIAATIAALFAVQLATIVATPIPSYRTGTDSHVGGLAKVHENELVELPNGTSFLTKAQEQLLNLPTGTRVNTAERTRQIIRPEQLKEYSERGNNAIVDMRPVVKAIEANKPIRPKGEDWRNIERRNQFKDYRNRRFK